MITRRIVLRRQRVVPGHRDPGDSPDGNQLPPERHALIGAGREHPHVLEAPDADEMLDRAAHVLHRERLADARFDELEHAALGHRDAGDLDAHIGDGLAEKILRLRSGHCQQQGRDDDEHQKACLFLTSRA